jgi:hypothetical protein
MFAHYVMHRIDAMYILVDVPKNRVCEMERINVKVHWDL